MNLNLKLTTVFLLCLSLILCIHADNNAQCTVNSVTTQFDKCGNTCCKTGVVAVDPSEGVIPGCCSDTEPTCQNGANGPSTDYKCCSVNAVKSGATMMGAAGSRTCYNSNYMDCCLIMFLDVVDNALVEKYDVTLYDKSTHKCCGDNSKGVLVFAADSFRGVVPIAQTCGTHIVATNVGTAAEAVTTNERRARCRNNNDCPSGLTCCIRPSNAAPKYPNETANGVDQYSDGDGLGQCIDSTVLDCCGGGSGIEVGAGSGSLTLTQFVDHKPYSKQHQICCPLDGGVIKLKRQDSCSCATDGDCATGSTCCNANLGASNSLIALTKCALTCALPSVKSAGCYGKCTMPERYDGKPKTCLRCGQSSELVVDGQFHRCCTQNDATVTRYDARTQQCCPIEGVRAGPGSYRCSCETNADCPSGQSCCKSTDPLGSGGQCMNSAIESCCQYGNYQYGIYTQETQVCCAVGGVKTGGYEKCLCAVDSQCPSGGKCCADTESGNSLGGFKRSPLEMACTHDHQTGCTGKCYSEKHQTCCNNPHRREEAEDMQICNTKTETCCEGSCCRKHLDKCVKADVFVTDVGSTSSMLWVKDNEENIKKCTAIESASPSVHFFAYAFPAFLTLIAIGLIVIGTSMGFQASSVVKYKLLAKLAVVVSILLGVLSILLLWAPTWKYAMAVLITNCAVLCAFDQGVWMKRFVIILSIATLLYLVDPVSNNAMFSFQSCFSGEYCSKGLQALTLQMTKKGDYNTPTYSWCTAFYQFFNRDPNLYDTARRFNLQRNPTHGICRYDWMHAITVFAGLAIAFDFLFVVLASLVLVSHTTS